MFKQTLMVALTLVSASAWADIHATEAWSRMTASTVKTGAVFLQLHNTGSQMDALVSAQSPVSKKVEIHNHINDNGVMRMRQIPNVVVAAGQTVSLQPGGYHLMLMELKQPLKLQQTFPMTLKYRSGHTEVIKVLVNNGQGMQQAMPMHKMPMHNMQHQH